MKHYTLECCVDSVESAIAAQQGGATRLELCGELMTGGITPTLGLFKAVKNHCTIPVRAIIRPRFGDFCYTKYELDTMIDDAMILDDYGVDGIVVGCLTPTGMMDCEKMELFCRNVLCDIALHRAFDMAKDPITTMETAIHLGIKTILTSGQKSSAMNGKELIQELVATANGRIELLVGGGVTSQNIQTLATHTRATAFHLSGKKREESPMIYRNPHVTMGLPNHSEYDIYRTQAKEIAMAKAVLEELLQ